MKFPRTSERFSFGLQVLSALTVSCLLCSCFDKEKETTLAAEVQEKQETFESLKRDLTGKNEEVRKISEEISELKSATRNLQRLQKQELEVTKEYNDLKKYEEEVKATSEILESSLQAWRNASRSSMVGLQLGALDLGGGKVLGNAVVMEVTDTSVRLSSQGTETVVDLADLPNELRERLGDESLVAQKIQIEQSQK
jgi:septal ring factor EnvC (AmiA/AmiB activator)